MTCLDDELKTLAVKVHDAAVDANCYPWTNNAIADAIDDAKGWTPKKGIEQAIKDFDEQMRGNTEPQIHLLNAAYHLILAAESARNHDYLTALNEKHRMDENATIINKHVETYLQFSEQVKQDLAKWQSCCDDTHNH